MRKMSFYGPSLVVLATAAIVLLAGPMAVHQLTHMQATTRAMLASERLQQPGSILTELNQAYQDVAAAVEPSVVHISAERRFEHPALGRPSASVSSGSGWIYDDDGHIVTNHHVVDGAERIDVQLSNGQTRTATVVGFDRSTDIAVLKIAPGQLYPATRSDGRQQIRRGEKVFAFGSPFDFRFSMSSGVVSGTGRSVGVLRDQWGNRTGSEYFIQVDAAINPGNSGGPLTDVRGHVVGMNTAIATNVRQSSNNEGQFSGVGLAIPIDMIETTVSQIISTGVVKKGYLGVHVVDSADAVRDEYRALQFPNNGVVIARLPASSNAEENQILRIGDVVTNVDGRQVGSPDQLIALVDNIEIGRTIDLAIWRFNEENNRGHRLRLSIDDDARDQIYRADLLAMSAPISERMRKLGFAGQGVLVTLADIGDPARSAGVQRGDIITHVNDKPVEETHQLQSIVASLRPNDVAELRIWRFDDELQLGQTLTIDVPLARLDLLRTRGILEPDRIRDSIPALGIERMADATPELAREYEVDYRPGVMLLEMVPDTPLYRRLAPGTIVVKVMDQPVVDIAQFLDALSRTNLRQGASVVVIHPDGSFDGMALQLLR